MINVWIKDKENMCRVAMAIWLAAGLAIWRGHARVGVCMKFDRFD